MCMLQGVRYHDSQSCIRGFGVHCVKNTDQSLTAKDETSS